MTLFEAVVYFVRRCRGGYCFVNLRSAIEFINVLDSSMLSISEDEFQRLVCSTRDSKTLEKLTLPPFHPVL